ARTYKAVVPTAPPAPALLEPAALPAPADPLAPELERLRHELADAQEELLGRLRQREQARGEADSAARQAAALAARCRALEAERKAQARGQPSVGAGQAEAIALAELRQRARALQAELEALRKAPPLKKALRYLTPVSRPLQTEEVVFECRAGRVTLVD